MVVEDRVDVGELDELLDVDRPGLLRVERVELVALDDDVAVGRELVALDDVLVGDLVAGARVDAALLDAHAGLAVELVEAHRLARDGGVELHRHRHQTEGDGACPHRAGHAPSIQHAARSAWRARVFAGAVGRDRARAAGRGGGAPARVANRGQRGNDVVPARRADERAPGARDSVWRYGAPGPVGTTRPRAVRRPPGCARDGRAHGARARGPWRPGRPCGGRSARWSARPRHPCRSAG